MDEKLKANRNSIRAPVAPTRIQGLLTVDTSGEQVPFLIWDVSQTGLGIWSPNPLPRLSTIKMTLAQPFPLVLEGLVKWCKPENGGNGYRSGIDVAAQASRLSALYELFRKDMEKKAASL